MRHIAVLLAVVVAFLLGWWLGSQRSAAPPPSEPRAAAPAEPKGATEPAERSAAESPDAVQRAPGAPRPQPPRAARPEAPVDDTPAFFADDPARPAGRLRTGRVTLLSRAKYDDYEKATFSFEHGIRDDPGRIAHNDWELEFGNGGDRFDVRMVTDDASAIADLGAFDGIEALAGATPPEAKLSATTAPAVAGHAYLVHTVDRDSDHFSVLHVVEIVPGDRVTFDWADWTPPRETDPKAPSVTPAARAGLVRLLGGAAGRELTQQRAEYGTLADASDLVVQIRSGAQGGNRSTVTLADPSTWTFAQRSEQPLDMAGPINMRQGSTLGFARGGYLPEDRALVIEALDVWATAPGDSNGNGQVIVEVKGETVLRLESGEGPVLDWYAGRAVIRPGEEKTVRVSVANSSAAEVRLHGRLVPLDEAAKMDALPLWAAAAPAGAARAAGGASGARSSALASPRAVIQVRAIHGGGNPMRASLLGKASVYLDKVVNEPLPVERPDEKSGRDSVAFVEGGRIPRGKAFVVTQVDWVGYVRKGSGSFSVSAMGQQIASLGRGDGPDEGSGTWTGRIVVPAGSEARVFVETAYYSFGMATLTGEFVDAAAAGK